MADIAPTLLHLMGQAVPDQMDGTVLMDALKSENLPKRSGGISDGRTPTSASPDEAEALRARLERLGYL